MKLTASLARAQSAHPEWWVYILAAAAWLGVVAIHLPSNPDPYAAHHHAHLSEAVTWPWTGALVLLPMVAAMMLPLVGPAAGHVARTSFWTRRQRAAACYVFGFATICVALGAGLVVARFLLPQHGTETLWLASTATGAALWQCSRPRRSTAQRCDGRPALPQRGWRATWRAIRAGGAFGLRCILLCGPAMAIMAVRPSLALMVVLFAVQTHEWRRSANPFAERRWRVPAGAYATIAGLAVVAGVI